MATVSRTPTLSAEERALIESYNTMNATPTPQRAAPAAAAPAAPAAAAPAAPAATAPAAPAPAAPQRRRSQRRRATQPAAPTQPAAQPVEPRTNTATATVRGSQLHGLSYEQYHAIQKQNQKKKIDTNNIIANKEGGAAWLALPPNLSLEAYKGTASLPTGFNSLQDVGVMGYRLDNMGLCSNVIGKIIGEERYFLSVTADKDYTEYANKLGYDKYDALKARVVTPSFLRWIIDRVLGLAEGKNTAKAGVLGTAAFGYTYFWKDYNRGDKQQAYNMAQKSEGWTADVSSTFIGPINLIGYMRHEDGYLATRKDAFWHFSRNTVGYSLSGDLDISAADLNFFARVDGWVAAHLTTTVAGESAGEMKYPSDYTMPSLFTDAIPESSVHDWSLHNEGRSFFGEMRWRGWNLLNDEGLAVNYTHVQEQKWDLKQRAQYRLGLDLWGIVKAYGAINVNLIPRFSGDDVMTRSWGGTVFLPITGKNALPFLRDTAVDTALQFDYYKIDGMAEGGTINFKVGFGGNDRPDRKHVEAYSQAIYHPNYLGAQEIAPDCGELIEQWAARKDLESILDGKTNADGTVKGQRPLTDDEVKELGGTR